MKMLTVYCPKGCVQNIVEASIGWAECSHCGRVMRAEYKDSFDAAHIVEEAPKSKEVAYEDMVKLLFFKGFHEDQSLVYSKDTEGYFYVYSEGNRLLGIYDYGGLGKCPIKNRTRDCWYHFSHPEINPIQDWLSSIIA